MNTGDHAHAVATLADEEWSRRKLLPFAVRMYPGFQTAPHLKMLAGLAERVFPLREIKRLIFSVHPGAGKSTLMALFGAWVLGRDPKLKVIVCSAGAELAERDSRASRAYFSDPAWPFATRLSQDTRAMNRWNTTDGGGMFAVGTGGMITGWRGDIILCSDIQDRAGSPLERDSSYSWFREILISRLEPNGAIVIVQQRWSEDDIPGRLMDAEDGHLWHVVNLPAIALEDDPLGREPGTALWPQRFGIEELQQRKTAMGSRAFETIFQGRPISVEGNLIKAEWIKRYDSAPELEYIVMALDAASKLGIHTDFSALAVLGVTENAFYLLDMIRKKVEYPELCRMVVDAYEKYAPTAILVEDTANAVALIQQFRLESRLPIVAVKPLGSKISRVEAITGTLEAGKLFLPKEAPWLVETEREMYSFPSGKHDDCVDALTMAIASQQKGRDGFGWGSVRITKPPRQWYE